MYFPYLHGRQSELLALRDFCTSFPFDKKVTPVIEPVRRLQNGLITALTELTSQSYEPIVVLNPVKLDFKSGDQGWSSQLLSSKVGNYSWIPAFAVDGTHSVNDVISFINFFSNRKVAIVYKTSKLSIADLNSIDSQPNVVYQIVLPSSLSYQQRGCVSKSKAVDISDCFNAQKRNADYNGVEFFSNQINTFKSTSAGYGDFTVLENKVSDEGGQASAVAIHATYKEPKVRDIYVENFVSTNTQRGQGTVGDKFLDAAGQLVVAANNRYKEFGNNIALDRYKTQVNTNHSPGLPTNKRQQILHHICLNRQILLGQI